MVEQHLNNNGCVIQKRTFEEEIYWTNFKTLRFFQLLSGDFLDHLVLPKKFSENLKGRLPQTLVLEGPGGAKSEVRLVKDNNGTLLKDGWREFAAAHKFLKSDLLLFKYKRDSYLKVTVFDRRSFCENAASYFVRQCHSPNKHTAEESRPKRKVRESSADAAVTKEESDFQSSDSEWANTAGSSRRKGRRQSEFLFRKRSDSEIKSPSTPNERTRRLPSAEEKERALQLAIKESTKDSCILVLKSSHVSNRSRVCIPAVWARNHLICKHQDLVLQIKEKMWIARLTFCNNSGSGILGTGWSVFVKDNSLQEDDVCVLDLSSGKGESRETAIVDVRIFYAGEKVVNQPSQKLSPM